MMKYKLVINPLVNSVSLETDNPNITVQTVWGDKGCTVTLSEKENNNSSKNTSAEVISAVNPADGWMFQFEYIADFEWVPTNPGGYYSGNKIPVVKLIRDFFSLDLGPAKEFVEKSEKHPTGMPLPPFKPRNPCGDIQKDWESFKEMASKYGCNLFHKSW